MAVVVVEIPGLPVAAVPKTQWSPFDRPAARREITAVVRTLDVRVRLNGGLCEFPCPVASMGDVVIPLLEEFDECSEMALPAVRRSTFGVHRLEEVEIDAVRMLFEELDLAVQPCIADADLALDDLGDGGEGLGHHLPVCGLTEGLLRYR